MTRWLLQLLIALDQLLNVLVCGGWADETMSSTAWRMEQKGKLTGRVLRPVIDWLASPWQADHCRKAWESERLRLHSSPSERMP
jgi:hypothetical protein